MFGFRKKKKRYYLLKDNLHTPENKKAGTDFDTSFLRCMSED